MQNLDSSNTQVDPEEPTQSEEEESTLKEEPALDAFITEELGELEVAELKDPKEGDSIESVVEDSEATKQLKSEE